MTTMAAYAATTFGIDEIGPALEVDGKKERSVYMRLNSIGVVVGVISRSLEFCSEAVSAYSRIENRIGTLL
jgi:hypothetical protein